MPDEIDRAVQQALEAVRSHPDHWLLPVQRRWLYTLLDGDKTAHTGAHVRAWLDLLSVEHVLPLWGPIPGGLEGETEVLLLMPKLTEQVLHGIIKKLPKAELAAQWPDAAFMHTREPDVISVREIASSSREVTDQSGETPDSQYFHTWCIYDAALTALEYALGIDNFATGMLTDTTTMITSAYGDAANYAVIAYAGGSWQAEVPEEFIDPDIPWVLEGYWDRDFDEVRARRREFWEWWLLEAMPRARTQAQQYR